MRILIVGYYPKTIGGVTNYTRPLALELSKSNEVFYLYNRLLANYFDFGGMRIEESKEFSEFRGFDLINGLGLEKNYDNLDVDSSKWMDEIFHNFLLRHKIEIIHINEIFGFSSSIINVARKQGIKVVVSVHEYWWLCPHRVMVDFNNKICEGPTSIQKCAFCVHNKLPGFNSKYLKRRERVRNSYPKIFKLIAGINSLRKSFYPKEVSSNTVDLKFGSSRYDEYQNPKLEHQLANRLQKNITALNEANLIVAVSKDVKNKLSTFGVDPSLILIQHIGSTIAENKTEHTKTVDNDRLVFGFIGGISYYKGIHQLVQAYLSMPDSYKSKCVIDLYGKYDLNYFTSINNLLTDDKYRKRIKFHGRYNPAEVPKITNSIDIMVLPSLCADTAPQTIFESFSCQLPIVAPRTGGFPDFIEDNVNGLLYSEASVESLKEKLMDIINNPDKINSFRNKIPPLKTLTNNALELVAVYRSLIAKKDPSTATDNAGFK